MIPVHNKNTTVEIWVIFLETCLMRTKESFFSRIYVLLEPYFVEDRQKSYLYHFIIPNFRNKSMNCLKTLGDIEGSFFFTVTTALVIIGT